MLTKHQIDRLAAFEGFLMELLDSPEFKEIEASDDFYPDLNLADALQAIGYLLDHQGACEPVVLSPNFQKMFGDTQLSNKLINFDQFESLNNF
jgi:hypothetical protein